MSVREFFATDVECIKRVCSVGATQDGGKPMLTLMISEDLVKTGLNAGQIVREATKLIQGGGGSQPFFAQAGSKNVEGLSAAEDKMMQFLGLK